MLSQTRISKVILFLTEMPSSKLWRVEMAGKDLIWLPFSDTLLLAWISGLLLTGFLTSYLLPLHPLLGSQSALSKMKI